MVRHKTVAIAKELGDTVKTCLLYLAMSQSNQTYIIEMNPFTKEKTCERSYFGNIEVFRFHGNLLPRKISS